MSEPLMRRTLRREETILPHQTHSHRNRKLRRRAEKQDLVDNPVAYALRSMGKTPIAAESAESYMREKLESLFPFSNAEAKKTPWERQRDRVKLVVIAVIVAAIVVSTATMFSGDHLLASMTVSAMCGIILWFAVTSRLRERMQDLQWKLIGETNRRSHARWLATPLEKYLGHSEVPQPVLDTAQQLRKRVPGIQLEVVHLYKDPFLRAKAQIHGRKTEVVYVEAWDESFVF